MSPISIGEGTNVQTFDNVTEVGDYILREHAAMLLVRKNYAAKRRHFGAILNQVRGSFEHGTWMPWLRSLGINVRVAQACMAAAAGRVPVKSALSAHFGGRLGEQTSKCALNAHLAGNAGFSDEPELGELGKLGELEGTDEFADDLNESDEWDEGDDDDTGAGGGIDAGAEDRPAGSSSTVFVGNGAGASQLDGRGVGVDVDPAGAVSASDATPEVVGRIVPRPSDALTTRVVTPKRLPGQPMVQLTLDSVYELVAATRVRMDRLAASTGAMRDRFEEATRRYQGELASIERGDDDIQAAGGGA